MEIVNKICGDIDTADSSLYEIWRERCPEYAEEWIKQAEVERHARPHILRMKLEGKSYRVIAEELKISESRAQKIGKPLVDKYKHICKSNYEKIHKAAGNNMTAKEQDDFAYMNDTRTVLTEMNVLSPILEDIKGLIDG